MLKDYLARINFEDTAANDTSITGEDDDEIEVTAGGLCRNWKRFLIDQSLKNTLTSESSLRKLQRDFA